MFLLSIFQWWYTIGWAERWRSIITKTTELAESFSLGIILTTLFKPWKQITTLEPDSSMVHRAVDSLVSRFVGFWVRLLVLFTGVGYILVAFVINTLVAIVWPLIPFMSIGFIIIGVAGL